MGLTGERGAQTEGKADTQHHCQITVGSFALKHHSPRGRMKEERNKDKVGERKKERKAETDVTEIKCEHSKRTVCQVLASVRVKT